MYSRTNSVTMTLKRESFALSRTASRSTEPEVFTFERITPQATAVRSYVPIRPKKRCTRVMYPAKVRMHLPPPEKNQAKRWLVILCLVVLWQIYTEEPCADTPLTGADSPVSDFQGFPFQCAEEQRRISDLSVGSELLSATQTDCQDEASPCEHIIPSTTTCPKPVEETESSLYEQSAGKSYMVALLVYHRLGSDN
ncbi:radiation-inducible immediate-early gene IEX-1 [Notolabrus celidotus]|uniref:radiation-inducible immediate-early gene IEX-1 n=1 Tax=Notolabrus celidotus TaxID=1203425 RepID=UPI00148FF160|nr:radiation-inducible immediate-early gene IEX-1 [Notolabrus celidotus]